MFCTHCGNKIADDVKFCTSCGAPVTPIASGTDSQAPAPEAQSVRETPSEPTPRANADPTPVVDVAPTGPEQQKPKRKRGLIAAVIILVVVFIIAATVGVLFALGIGPFARATAPANPASQEQPKDDASSEPAATRVAVPDVTGMDEHDAMDEIRAAGLSIGEIEEQHSSTAAEGTVLGQTPGADDEVDEGTEIDLVVSSGPETTVEHRYQVITEARTWSDAQAYCEAHGGYLATVSTADEYQHILDILPSSGTAVVWLGASRSGDSWEWVDGAPLSFTAWASGEPNNDGGNENHLVLLKANGSWAWYDVPNDVSSFYSADKLAFVMETEVEVPLS